MKSLSLLIALCASSAIAATDALDEVNGARAQMGLPAFQRDEALTQGALAAAEYRAANGVSLHTYNDFAFLPPGSSASGSGTGLNGGPLNCCYATSSYPVAGAAYATGRDGIRRVHIFVSTRFNGPIAKVAHAVTHPLQTIEKVHERKVEATTATTTQTVQTQSTYHYRTRLLFRRWR